MPTSSNKNITLNIDDVIHVSNISMYDVAVIYNFNNLSVVINTYLKTEIMVSIQKIDSI